MRCRAVLFVALSACLVAACVRAGEVQVAVAANFAGTLKRIAPGFTAATGHVLKISSGATGKFHAQIASGAPFELLLSADEETPRKLIAEGHAVAGSRFTYAVGRLALWSARPDLVDDKGEVLRRGRFAHLAIANPKVAPYGAAAVDALTALGLLDAVSPKFVTGESIAQAWQFVATGNAELGFVALSQVMAQGAPKGSYWLVPPELHHPLRQDAVLLKPGTGNPAAEALLVYLQSDAAKAVMREHGYGH